MSIPKLFNTALLCAILLVSNLARADGGSRADSHAPIGVMGEHMHRKGEFMLSYRLARMPMAGNSDMGQSLSPSTIARTAPNPFYGQPMQPPTLRVVPTDMSMQMHMVGLMYAPTDWLTLMAMTGYAKKDMNHITFAGPMGTDQLGVFEAGTSGMTDSSVSGLIRIREWDKTKLHATLGVSLPTGSVDETVEVLAPTGMRPTVTAPYPMQLGSGTYDAITGLTITHFADNWSLGSQWRSVLRNGGNNKRGYTLGDEHKVNAWFSYLAKRNVSLSVRSEYSYREDISGMDATIMAPVQTADPNRQSARILRLGAGVNVVLNHGQRLALEILAPVYQDLHGPQLEQDWHATLGYQYAF